MKIINIIMEHLNVINWFCIYCALSFRFVHNENYSNYYGVFIRD